MGGHGIQTNRRPPKQQVSQAANPKRPNINQKRKKEKGLGRRHSPPQAADQELQAELELAQHTKCGTVNK